MTKTGYDAYKQTHKNGLKGRALEGESFMKAVQLLRQAQEFDGNRKGSYILRSLSIKLSETRFTGGS